MTEFLLPALLATALAGLVRGFTGFGGALVMAPVLLTLTDPISTTAIVIIVNVVAGILQAREIHREADWGIARPLCYIALLTAPIGLWSIHVLDIERVRQIVGAVVLLATLTLLLRWRFPSPSDNRSASRCSVARLLLSDSDLYVARHGCESIADDATLVARRAALAHLLPWRTGRRAPTDAGSRAVVSTRLHRGAVRGRRLRSRAVMTVFHTGQNPFLCGTLPLWRSPKPVVCRSRVCRGRLAWTMSPSRSAWPRRSAAMPSAPMRKPTNRHPPRGASRLARACRGIQGISA